MFEATARDLFLSDEFLSQTERVLDSRNDSAAGVSREKSLSGLRQELASSLVSLEQLRPPAGLPTGIDSFDDFLLWKGLPQGDLTLLNGRAGTGATSLWLSTAARIHKSKKWVAWVNSDWELLPSHLLEKGIDLDKLLVVKKPESAEKLFWVLQELISSGLFEMIGCHLREGTLKVHQLQKLKKLSRTHQVALVIVSHGLQWPMNPLFSLVIDCRRDFFVIRRALHRPTPFHVSGSLIYADLMPALTTSTKSND